MDQALIIYPLAAGIGLTLYNIGASIKESSLAALGSLLTWGLAGAVGGYGYKSYHSYQVKKQDYSLKLTKSLYYKSLDNNTGVLMRLLDEAEEQECRETILAYFCLWKFAPPEGWTAEQLDDYIELYLEGNANLKVDFEIGDALAKLERLEDCAQDWAIPITHNHLPRHWKCSIGPGITISSLIIRPSRHHRHGSYARR